MFEPFKILSRNYNVPNLKKIYDLFPRYLKSTEIVSDELLDQLRENNRIKDIRIQELLDSLDALSNQSLDVDFIYESLFRTTEQLTVQLDNLSELTGVEGVDTINDFVDSTERENLLGRGFIQIGTSSLFVKVEKVGTYTFNMNHSDENGQGIRISDLQSPNQRSITFKNVSKENPVYFTKEERWLTSSDSKYNPQGRFTVQGKPGGSGGQGFPLTNVFNFQTVLPLAVGSVSSFTRGIGNATYVIQPNVETTVEIKLGYTSKDDYNDAGLKREDRTNTFTGEMYIYASDQNLTFSALKNKNITSIGSTRLYRDQN
jgi:hypothetical protein